MDNQRWRSPEARRKIMIMVNKFLRRAAPALRIAYYVVGSNLILISLIAWWAQTS